MNSAFLKWLERNIIVIIIVSGICILFFPLLLSLPASYALFDLSSGGPIGDVIGGTTAPIIGVVSIILLVLTLKTQKDADYKSQLENRIFQLIKIHQDNVSSMRMDDNGAELSGREVFSMIKRQILSCIREIKPLIDAYESELFTKEFESDYGNLGIEIDRKEFAILDMAFSIVYIGVDKESLTQLKSILSKRYSEGIVNLVIWNSRLRPFRSAEKTYDEWELWSRLSANKRMRLLPYMVMPFEKIEGENVEQDIKKSFPLLHRQAYRKYYAGHQFRLGHYYRNLYMIIEYISNEQTLQEEERYKYVKIIRSQLSTTEQLLLMANSITYLGREWELYAENEKKYFTRYNLIKNIPQDTAFGVEYRKIYPNVKYEVSISLGESI